MGGARYKKCENCKSIQSTSSHFCKNCGLKFRINAISLYDHCITNNLKHHEEWSNNNKLKPYQVSYSTKDKYLFICKNNHEYLRGIDNKLRNIDCPYCSGQKVLIGFNDLLTTNSEIKEKWNYNKNNIKLTEVTAGSNKKVWWKCKFGHEWNSTIVSGIKTKCPICSNKKVLFGFNDVLTTHPDLLEFWDYEKNTIKPSEITYGYSKDIFWKCKYEHSYNATFPEIINENRCPYCSGHRVLKGFNDLWTTHHDICKELVNKSNGYKYSQGSNKKIYWICSKKHKYKMMINDRTKGLGCPYCSNQRVLTGFNDVNTTHSFLLEEWDFKKNIIKPTEITYGYDKKIYWICKKCKFSWKTQIYRRVGKDKNGCPKCNRSKGENKIAFILDKYHIYYKTQKVFSECRNKACLRFDFWLPDYNTLIEYQGIQHFNLKYKYYDYNIEDGIKRDSIKREYCKNNNLKLLEISYTDFKNIEEIIAKTINLNHSTIQV